MLLGSEGLSVCWRGLLLVGVFFRSRFLFVHLHLLLRRGILSGRCVCRLLLGFGSLFGLGLSCNIAVADGLRWLAVDLVGPLSEMSVSDAGRASNQRFNLDLPSASKRAHGQ